MTSLPHSLTCDPCTPYLYYACISFTKDGRHTSCPVKMLPARPVEALIKQALADLGGNPTILQACVDEANHEAVRSVDQLEETQTSRREEIGRLTAGIRRIIKVMKAEDLLSEDIREEYKRLVAEKERLQAVCEKLQLDIERRRKRVLDVELIRRSLQDFERLVGLLPLEDQKELFQLLLREVEVRPFEPSEQAPEEDGVVDAKVRSKWYRIKIELHQLPGVELVKRARGESSDFGGSGSPTRIRTSNLPVNSRALYR